VVVVVVVVELRAHAPNLARLTRGMHIYTVDFLENGSPNFFKLRTPVAHARDYRLAESEKIVRSVFFRVALSHVNL
jgi:hypothetical protein